MTSQQRHIIFIEDEHVARHLIAKGLRERGYNVEAIASAEQAIPLLTRPWWAVITDIRLGGASGLSILQAIRALHLTKYPITIVVTSYADKDIAITALNLGAQYLLEKPFSVDRLCQVLDQLSHTAPTPILDDRLAQLPLSEKDRHLLSILLQGASNYEISLQLGIAEQSVKNQLSRIYRKLGVDGRASLMAQLFSH